MSMHFKEIEEILECPCCHGSGLKLIENSLACSVCKAEFSIIDDIPVLLPEKESIASQVKHDAAGKHYDELPLVHYWDSEGSPIGKYRREGLFDNKGKQIVEIGCGTGTIAEYLMKNTEARPLGIDLAHASLRQAKRLGMPLLQASNFSIPLKDEVSDITISYGVIHHTPDPACCMRELTRITKTGGDIILVLFRKWSLYYFWWLLYAPLPRLLRKVLGKFADFLIFPFYLLCFYPVFWLGLIVYHKKIRPPEIKGIWSTFNDQFLSPNESFHTRKDVYAWAKENNLEVKDIFYFCRPGGGAIGTLLKKRK